MGEGVSRGGGGEGRRGRKGAWVGGGRRCGLVRMWVCWVCLVVGSQLASHVSPRGDCLPPTHLHSAGRSVREPAAKF